MRIASLLHAREESLNTAGDEHGVTTHDFAQLNGNGKRRDGGGAEEDEHTRKRRRVKHKVVIHSSPFLRCLQTSVAIAAGMAQYCPPTVETGKKTSSKLHTASPRLRTTDGHDSPNLAPVAEPKHDFAHTIARKALHEHILHHRKSKLCVDAFLGEWLNPQYFDQITPPPPSAMMVKSAKVELIQNENVEIFTPAVPAISTKSSNSSLWSGANGGRNASRESTLDDWSRVEDTLPSSPTSPTSPRSRASSHSNTGSNDSAGHRSPLRPGAPLQPLTSNVPKQETAIYHPPTPHYAVSSSDHIPRGYVAHARNACTSVDYAWDSSRAPQDWGSGGEYGEEWSAMHKRLRRGLNRLVQWYGHGDETGEDALGFEQAERHDERDEEEAEQEDLVVVLITHGAGSNALIGALTGQPVLLDVGMASLTMAVRRDDASGAEGTAMHSPLNAEDKMLNGASAARRSSLDFGLSSLYEMKIIASTEHLRPSGGSSGGDPNRASFRSSKADLAKARDSLSTRKPRNLVLDESARSSTSSSLGTIRRPSGAMLAAPASELRSSSMPPGERVASPLGLWTRKEGAVSPGLWTPTPTSVGGGTPVLDAQTQVKGDGEGERRFSELDGDEGDANLAPDGDVKLDSSDSFLRSHPVPSNEDVPPPSVTDESTNGHETDGASDVKLSSNTSEGNAPVLFPKPGENMSSTLIRGLSNRGLWGSKPSGDQVERRIREGPKRRWTVDQE